MHQTVYLQSSVGCGMQSSSGGFYRGYFSNMSRRQLWAFVGHSGSTPGCWTTGWHWELGSQCAIYPWDTPCIGDVSDAASTRHPGDRPEGSAPFCVPRRRKTYAASLVAEFEHKQYDIKQPITLWCNSKAVSQLPRHKTEGIIVKSVTELITRRPWWQKCLISFVPSTV